MKDEQYIIRMLLNHCRMLEEDIESRKHRAKNLFESYEELSNKLKFANEIIDDFKLSRNK